MAKKQLAVLLWLALVMVSPSTCALAQVADEDSGIAASDVAISVDGAVCAVCTSSNWAGLVFCNRRYRPGTCGRTERQQGSELLLSANRMMMHRTNQNPNPSL